MKIELNPFEVPTKSLRTLAHFFNCLAADAEGKQHPVVEVIDSRTAADVPPPPPAIVGNERPDVPSASDLTIPPPPPVADAQQEQSSSDAGELDKNGLPWDARIHASTKGKNQDGSWKALRGVDKSIVPGIEAELRARVGTPAPVPAAEQTPPPPPPIPTDDQAPPPPPPVPSDSEAPPPPPGLVTMQQAFQRATAMKQQKLIDQEGLNTCLQMVGLSTMAEFLNACKERPEVAGEFLDALNAFAGDE